MSSLKSAKLVAVMVGKVQEHPPQAEAGPYAQPWRSAFIKDEVEGRVAIRRLGVDGDEVANRDVHGGPEQSVLAYPYSHYKRWQSELKNQEMGPGGFGENLSIDGLDEHSVCLGDSYQIGSVLLQVSLPRLPCASIDRRWQRKGLMKQVGALSRTGWYFRVLEEGEVGAGDLVTRTSRPLPNWTVSDVLQLRMHAGKGNVDRAEELAECELLAPHWREHFAQRACRAGATS